MKNIALLLLGVLGLTVFAGCESMGGVSEKFQPTPRHAQPFAVDQREAYVASRAALTQLAFNITGGGAAQGKIEAVSPISAGDTINASRQITASVRLTALLEGGTEVQITLSEVIEDNFNKGPGMGTQTPLRDTPLYEVFFRKVQQAIDADKAAAK